MAQPIPKDEESFSLNSTVARVNALEKTVNDLRIYTRRLDLYPFDTVAGEMLAKAFALSRSVIVLIQNGYPDEAFGLCRSLYECFIYLRYITRDCEMRDERSRAFLEFGVTSKAFWFDMLDKSSHLTDEDRSDIQRYKTENMIPDDPKRITQPWSGTRKLIEKVSGDQHPMDADDSTEDFRDRQRAISYTDTSSYVHCTQPGLNSYSHVWKEPIHIKRTRLQRLNNGLKACVVIQVHLREIVRYCFFGMQVMSLADLKTCGHAPSESGESSGEKQDMSI